MTDPRILMHRNPELSPPLSQEFAAALGYVVANWAMVEDYLGSIIRFLMGREDNAGYAITLELSTIQRTNLITTLMHEARDQSAYDDWQGILTALDPVRAERNELVHSVWSPHFAYGHVQFRMRARGKITGTFEARTAGDLLAASERILALLDMLAPFTSMIIGRQLARDLANPPTRPPLVPGQGLQARAQDQARAEKKAQRDADRLRSKTQGGKNDAPKD